MKPLRGPRRGGSGGFEVRPLSLRANALFLSAGRFVNAASQWVVLVVLAKLSSVSTVGEYAYAMAVCTPIVAFAKLGLRDVKVTDTQGEHAFGDYAGLRALSGLCALLAVAATATVLRGDLQAGLVIALMGLARVVDIQSDIFHALFQSHDRLDYAARSLALQGLLSLTLLAGGVALTGSLAIGILGRVIANLVVFWFHDVRTARRRIRGDGDAHAPGHLATPVGPDTGLRPVWRREILLRLAWQALPLGLAGLFAELSLNLSRYFIAHELGVEQLGYFAAMIAIGMAPSRLIAAVGNSATATLARHYASRKLRAFFLLLGKMATLGIGFGAAMLLIVALAGGPILTLAYSADYARELEAFLWITAGVAVRYVAVLTQRGILAVRRFRVALLLHAITALTALVASWSLIGRYGLPGAGMATLATSSVHLLSIVIALVWAARAAGKTDESEAEAARADSATRE